MENFVIKNIYMKFKYNTLFIEFHSHSKEVIIYFVKEYINIELNYNNILIIKLKCAFRDARQK